MRGSVTCRTLSAEDLSVPGIPSAKIAVFRCWNTSPTEVGAFSNGTIPANCRNKTIKGDVQSASFFDGKLMFSGERHCVRTHPVRKVLRSFFKSDPPVILRPQACGALRALARWFISLAPPPSRERTLWLKLTFRKSIPLSLLLGVCRFFFVKRGAKKNLSKRNAAPAGKEVAF